jgi:hypothetical protein
MKRDIKDLLSFIFHIKLSMSLSTIRRRRVGEWRYSIMLSRVGGATRDENKGF